MELILIDKIKAAWINTSSPSPLERACPDFSGGWCEVK